MCTMRKQPNFLIKNPNRLNKLTPSKKNCHWRVCATYFYVNSFYSFYILEPICTSPGVHIPLVHLLPNSLVISLEKYQSTDLICDILYFDKLVNFLFTTGFERRLSTHLTIISRGICFLTAPQELISTINLSRCEL